MTAIRTECPRCGAVHWIFQHGRRRCRCGRVCRPVDRIPHGQCCSVDEVARLTARRPGTIVRLNRAGKMPTPALDVPGRGGVRGSRKLLWWKRDIAAWLVGYLPKGGCRELTQFCAPSPAGDARHSPVDLAAAADVTEARDLLLDALDDPDVSPEHKRQIREVLGL